MPEVTLIDENSSHVRFGADDESFAATDRAEFFVFGRDNGDDIIANFDPAQDIINLTRLNLEPDELQSDQTDDGLLFTWNGGSVLLEGFTGEPEPTWLLTVNPADGSDVDIVFGGGGDDTIVGTDGGTLIVSGGEGNDTIVTAGTGDIIVLDFDTSEDTLFIDNAAIEESDLELAQTDDGLQVLTDLGGQIDLLGVADIPSGVLQFGDGSFIDGLPVDGF